jgi:hypothetical protein
MSEYGSEFERLMASTWPTRQLADFALYWENYDDGRTPLWQRISSTEREAIAFYASLTDEQELRGYACEVLTDGGWTLDRINYRKS